jgi:hypothetical protein
LVAFFFLKKKAAAAAGPAGEAKPGLEVGRNLIIFLRH